MKLHLVSKDGAVLGTYYVGDTDEHLLGEDYEYLLPTPYIERHPRGAALDLGKKVLKDIKELTTQGYR